MTHLWSLPMWIMSLASSTLTFLKYLLLVKMWSICSSFPFWRDERRLFLRSLPEHHTESGSNQLTINQLFNQSPLLLLSLRVYLPTLLRSVPFPRPKLSIGVSSDDWNVFITVRHVLLDCFVHLLNVVVRIFRVGKAHTHQLDVLTVHQARSLMYSVSMILFLHLLFSIIPTPCL